MQLLTVKQVASMLNVSPRTVWTMHAGRRIPAPIKLGRLVRWREETLKQWISAGCPENTAPFESVDVQ